MRNYVQPGDSLALAVPYAGGVTSGEGVLVGALFGVAAVDGVQNAVDDPIDLHDAATMRGLVEAISDQSVSALPARQPCSIRGRCCAAAASKSCSERKPCRFGGTGGAARFWERVSAATGARDCAGPSAVMAGSPGLKDGPDDDGPVAGWPGAGRARTMRGSEQCWPLREM